MNDTEMAALVAAHRFSTGLSPEQVHRLIRGAELVDLEAGQPLFHEGEPAARCYLVVAGQIDIALHLPGRGGRVVGTVGPGEIVGWSWLVPPHEWRFDATARTVTLMVALDASTIWDACEDDAELALGITTAVVTTMASRLEATRHQLLDVYSHDRD